MASEGEFQTYCWTKQKPNSETLCTEKTEAEGLSEGFHLTTTGIKLSDDFKKEHHINSQTEWC